MSTTTIKTFQVRAFRSVKDAFAGMNPARRRRFELGPELPHDHRKRAEIQRIEALMRLRPRI